MPCGCGKTLVATRTAEHLAHSGHVRRTLVMVPTLDLLVQTARVWQEQNDHHGARLAVCSPRADLDEIGIPQTTDPAELAALLDGLDHYTVFATYASLADGEDKQGALLTAHAARTLPAWDLLIADEAHRTSGSINKAWAAVHDDDKVPACRRLYYTATPQIWESDPAYSETLRPGAAAVADFHNEHGHLAPPRTLPGQGTDPRFLELPAWLDAQRSARRSGELKPWQTDFLDEIGMVWEPRSENRQPLITYARQVAAEFGGLAVSSGYTTPDGRTFGRDLNNLRQRAANLAPDADPTTEDQKGFADLLDALFELDPWWNPPWDLAWQRHYQQAHLRHARGEKLTQPGDTRTYRQWLRNPGDNLTPDQNDPLRAIDHAPAEVR
ncbi:DEAD/DEAH box helicase family protein [Streptomyces sp. NPDC059752]|uniref:helicase associated domain-containing protein n=1 Tax=unclassified Streptomyces TaxID=2593676 RepID=UPI003663E819